MLKRQKIKRNDLDLVKTIINLVITDDMTTPVITYIENFQSKNKTA